jgi:L-cystine uptake protein TcyP (sodium:dicarboxylate symporter family)
MRLIQYLVTPLYAGLRKVRDFDAESASYGAKTEGALFLFLFLFFKVILDIFYLLIIDTSIFKQIKWFVNYDFFITIPISIILSVFYTSSKYWEEKYQQDGLKWFSLATTIFVFFLLLLIIVLAGFPIHNKLEKILD